MVELTPLGSEFESIIVAVILFLAGGILCFLCCFGVTHAYLFYKRRVLRKKRRHEKSDVENSWSEVMNPTFGFVKVYSSQLSITKSANLSAGSQYSERQAYNAHNDNNARAHMKEIRSLHSSSSTESTNAM